MGGNSGVKMMGVNSQPTPLGTFCRKERGRWLSLGGLKSVDLFFLYGGNGHRDTIHERGPRGGAANDVLPLPNLALADFEWPSLNRAHK